MREGISIISSLVPIVALVLIVVVEFAIYKAVYNVFSRILGQRNIITGLYKVFHLFPFVFAVVTFGYMFFYSFLGIFRRDTINAQRHEVTYYLMVIFHIRTSLSFFSGTS